MNGEFGPLDAGGKVPAWQQTRVSAFLMSAHGAWMRQLATTLLMPVQDAWQVEMHAQYCREAETVSLLARATSWVFDPSLLTLAWTWETAWMPQTGTGPGIGPGSHPGADHAQAMKIDLAAFGLALHAAIRPAALLPAAANPLDPFVLALRRIEFESGRLMQAQLRFLKDPALSAGRAVVEPAVERRHAQIKALWEQLVAGLQQKPASAWGSFGQGPFGLGAFDLLRTMGLPFPPSRPPA